MDSKQSKKVFHYQLEKSGLNLNELSVDDGVKAMVDFYSSQRAQGCLLEDDGDMLLWQWGPCFGDKWFEVNITRQFMRDDEDEPYQLSLTFTFSVTPEILRGDKWCENPDKIDEFKEFIQNSEGYKNVKGLTPKKVILIFEQC